MLEIIVKGLTGTGKTTIGRAFQEFLQSRGFTNVTFTDDDVPTSNEHQEYCMRALQNTEIQIKTFAHRQIPESIRAEMGGQAWRK